MSVKTNIEADLKTALLSGDKEKAEILRTIKSSILQAEVDGGKRDSGLSDQESTKILSKEHKKRHEAAKMYADANEQERADKELKEAQIIEAYLPKQLSDEELTKLVAEVVASLGIDNVEQKDMGRIIGATSSKAAGQADGARISAVVKSLIK